MTLCCGRREGSCSSSGQEHGIWHSNGNGKRPPGSTRLRHPSRPGSERPWSWRMEHTPSCSIQGYCSCVFWESRWALDLASPMHALDCLSRAAEPSFWPTTGSHPSSSGIDFYHSLLARRMAAMLAPCTCRPQRRLGILLAFSWPVTDLQSMHQYMHWASGMGCFLFVACSGEGVMLQPNAVGESRWSCPGCRTTSLVGRWLGHLH